MNDFLKIPLLDCECNFLIKNLKKLERKTFLFLAERLLDSYLLGSMGNEKAWDVI